MSDYQYVKLELPNKPVKYFIDVGQAVHYLIEIMEGEIEQLDLAAGNPKISEEQWRLIYGQQEMLNRKAKEKFENDKRLRLW